MIHQSIGYVADTTVASYVTEVGQKLAAVSDPKLPHEFKVLNNSIPNAWALPGAKISINRGLLTELRSEAELAVISNPTPKKITGLVIALQFPDANGRLQEVQRKIRGQLRAEKKQQVDLGVKVKPKQARQVRSKIVAARIAK